MNKSWLPESTWKLMLASMPIPCVDLICVNDKGEILYGWRIIIPYKNVWALPGGRMLRGETPERAALRHMRKHGITAKGLALNGVFSDNFGWRTDISTNFIARGASWSPSQANDREFSKMEWKSKIPSRLGGIYKKMLKRYTDTDKSHLITSMV